MAKIDDRYIKFGVGHNGTNDGDIPSIYTPVLNFVPVSVAGEPTDRISAYLKGIDNAFGTINTGNIDGGTPSSNFGGTTAINGGTP